MGKKWVIRLTSPNGGKRWLGLTTRGTFRFGRRENATTWESKSAARSVMEHPEVSTLFRLEAEEGESMGVYYWTSVKTPRPRVCSYMLQRFHPHYHQEETWIEAEEYCYPGGGMHRRARVLFPDGVLRVVRCGIPDSAFSIPVRGRKGYIENDHGVLRFRPFET